MFRVSRHLGRSWRYAHDPHRRLPAGLALAAPALAQDSGADLAKQISNPVSSLVSVPLQFNYNGGFSGGTASNST
jgi:hypothetical protein